MCSGKIGSTFRRNRIQIGLEIAGTLKFVKEQLNAQKAQIFSPGGLTYKIFILSLCVPTLTLSGKTPPEGRGKLLDKKMEVY